MRLTLLVFCFISLIAFGQIELELPEIEGPIEQSAPPKGWQVYTGSPDMVEGAGIWFNSPYTLEYITGEKMGASMIWMMCTRPNNPEAMQTELTGLTIGEKYSVSIMWQQCAMMQDGQRMYWGGDLEMIVQGESTIFTSEGVDDDWQKATVSFRAKAKKITVAVSMHNPDYDPASTWGGCIAVDNFCPTCVDDPVSEEIREAGGITDR